MYYLTEWIYNRCWNTEKFKHSSNNGIWGEIRYHRQGKY